MGVEVLLRWWKQPPAAFLREGTKPHSVSPISVSFSTQRAPSPPGEGWALQRLVGEREGCPSPEHPALTGRGSFGFQV